jgi:hypothetical protein
LLLAASPLVVGLAACGGDESASSDAITSDAITADVTLPPVADTTVDGDDDGADAAGDYTYPTGADDVVVRYAEEGGFTTRERAFQQTPVLLISGDGRAFSPGAQIAVFPGPLLPVVQVAPITDAGIRTVLGTADALGLLADVEYTDDLGVADATTAVVTLAADGEVWQHEAYALGLTAAPGGDAMSDARAALAEFTSRLGALPALVGDELGEAELFDPAEFGVVAIEVPDIASFGVDGIEPTVVDWPSDVSVRLAEATQCTVVPASEVAELFADADELTLFDDAGTTYQLLVRPVLPGATC